MDNNLYQRQIPLQLSVPQAITVIGCGGIGSWVAIDAAMSGVDTIFLFDPDIMEEHNRNRLPFCQGSLNRPKVEVVRDYILAIRPQCNVIAIQERLDGILLEIQLKLGIPFIECTDSPKSQIQLYNECKKHNVHFIKAGYDGTHITVTSNVSGWIKAAAEETYAIAPSWVVPAQIVAAVAIAKLMKYPTQETSLDISEIGMPILAKRPSPRGARCRERTGGSR
jgi:molybdopterin/thiamine biosynthesis adenylyltransferase